jgi:hypothetical protein
MRKYLVERRVPNVGKMDRDQLRAAAAKSNQVLADLAPDVQWQQSFVADDHFFCIYFATDESMVRKHAELAGFPADRVIEIRRTIDPATAAA